MRAISRAIDKFCRKHRRFGIPRLMMYVVAISAVVFVLDMMDRSMTLRLFMIFHPDAILQGEAWRIITWVFLPVRSELILAAIMLYFYYFVGTSLEREWGTPKFTIYYVFGILLNIIYGFVLRYALNISPNNFLLISLASPLVNPIYLNMSLFFAFAVLFPDHTIRLFFIIPIKVKWLGLINGAFFAYSIISQLLDGNYILAFLPLVALLNFFLICGGDLLSHFRPFRTNRSSQFTNYRKAAKKTRRGAGNEHYRHKCAVCSKTDSDFPDLEFRYCSRCEGYHCFCIEHINSHVHFT